MEIQRPSERGAITKLLLSLKSARESMPRIVLGALISIVLTSAGLGIFYAGIQLDKSKLYTPIQSAIALNWRIPINISKGIFANPEEELSIDINHVNLQKLYFTNDYAIEHNGGILNTIDADSSYVAISISDRNNTTRGKARNKGNWRDARSNKKLALRIRLPDDNTILGMKRFSIHDPAVKGYLSEWIFHELLKYEDIISPRYDFVRVKINGDDKGIFALEEHFDKRLIENNQRREGAILRLDESNQLRSHSLLSRDQRRRDAPDYEDNSYSISPIDTYGDILEDSTLFGQFERGTRLFEAFRRGQLPASQVFDVNRLAKLLALSDLLGDSHNLKAKNIKFYLNPLTSRIEPIGYDQHHPISYLNHLLGENKKLLEQNDIIVWPEQLFNDPIFYERYIGSLREVSAHLYLDEFAETIEKAYETRRNLIYKSNPLYIDNSLAILAENQEYIRRRLGPEKLTETYFQGYESGAITIRVGNTYSLPIEVTGLYYGNQLMETTSPGLLDTKFDSEVLGFEDYVFVTHGIDQANFDPTVLRLGTRLMGDTVDLIEDINPWPLAVHISELKDDIFISPRDPSEFVFLSLYEDRILFNQENVEVSEDLVIPDGYEVHIPEGTRINLVNGASIVSFSPIMAVGTEDRPIRIMSSDGLGSGLVVLNTDKDTQLEYVKFENLSNPSQNGWEMTGAVTFYEADVVIRNTLFSGNRRGDDYINIIRSNFDIRDSQFYDVMADALDSDFSIGSVTGSSFINTGNDAIDSSGSTIEVTNVIMSGIGDKGISVGENSRVLANDMSISDAAIGMSSKDNSNLRFSNVSLRNSAIGLAAFQKKSEYGPGAIEGNSITMVNVSTPYLIERLSSCVIDNEIIESNQERIRDLLYGIKSEVN